MYICLDLQGASLCLLGYVNKGRAEPCIQALHRRTNDAEEWLPLSTADQGGSELLVRPLSKATLEQARLELYIQTMGTQDVVATASMRVLDLVSCEGRTDSDETNELKNDFNIFGKKSVVACLALRDPADHTPIGRLEISIEVQNDLAASRIQVRLD
jgi:hypothetical protein